MSPQCRGTVQAAPLRLPQKRRGRRGNRWQRRCHRLQIKPARATGTLAAPKRLHGTGEQAKQTVRDYPPKHWSHTTLATPAADRESQKGESALSFPAQARFSFTRSLDANTRFCVAAHAAHNSTSIVIVEAVGSTAFSKRNSSALLLWCGFRGISWPRQSAFPSLPGFPPASGQTFGVCSPQPGDPHSPPHEGRPRSLQHTRSIRLTTRPHHRSLPQYRGSPASRVTTSKLLRDSARTTVHLGSPASDTAQAQRRAEGAPAGPLE